MVQENVSVNADIAQVHLPAPIKKFYKAAEQKLQKALAQKPVAIIDTPDDDTERILAPVDVTRTRAVSSEKPSWETVKTTCMVLGYLNLIYNILYSLYLIIVSVFVYESAITFPSMNFSSLTDVQEIWVNTLFYQEIRVLRGSTASTGVILTIFMIYVPWVIINVACFYGLYMKRQGWVRIFIGFVVARTMFALTAIIDLFTLEPHLSQEQSRAVISEGGHLLLSTIFIFYYMFIVTCDMKKKL